jgi:hypothetical protein
VAQPKFTLYKHVKINGECRYCRAAVASNNKVKPHIVLVGGQEEKHEESAATYASAAFAGTSWVS